MNRSYRLSRFHVVSPPAADQKQAGRLRRVVFGTRKAKAHLIDDAAWAAVAEGAWEALPPEVREALVESQILVPADEDELQTVLDENAAAARDDRSLYLVVQPTAWCQLGCTYCGQRHTQQLLSPENQDRLVERVRQSLASGRFNAFQVCWFGGEPLAGLTVMRALSRRFRAAADEHGCAYDAKMVTNGLLLTPEIADEVIREMAVGRIEVTIDGTAEYHDRRRPAKNGAGSFERIFGNVVAMLKRGEDGGPSPLAGTARGQSAVDGKANGDSPRPSLSIRCNVDPQNREGVRPLLERFAAAGVQDQIESFYVAPVFNWGNDAGQQNVTREEFARWEIEWFVAMYRLGFPVAVLPQREKTGCLAMKPDAELVDPHGVLFKCSEVPLVPAYEDSRQDACSTIGCASGCGTNRYAVGNLVRGVDPGRFAFRDFTQRIRRGEYPCRECPLLPACGGYCPKKWDDGEVPCPAFKYNIEQRLLLAYAIGRLDGQVANLPDAR